MEDNGKMTEAELGEIIGGTEHDVAIKIAKNSKFSKIREMAEKEEEKLNTGAPHDLIEKEYTEDELDKMAYDYYHGDENVYKR